MTYEDFQAAKEWCDDLHGRFPDDVQPGSKGWLYCGGQLWVEDTSAGRRTRRGTARDGGMSELATWSGSRTS